MRLFQLAITFVFIFLNSDIVNGNGNDGSIYFIRSNQLYQLSLNTLQSRSILTDEIIASPIELFDNDMLVVRNKKIIRINPNSFRQEVITNGYNPSYLPKNRTLFFYREQGEDEWLFCKNGNGEKKIARSPIHRNQLATNVGKAKKVDKIKTRSPVKYNDENIAFIGENGNLWTYSVKDAKLNDTGISDCSPLLAIENGVILCKSHSGQSVFILRLRNGEKDTLPLPNKTGAFAYNKELGVLYFSTVDTEFFIREIYPLMFYSFHDGRTGELLHNFPVSSMLWTTDTVQK